MADAARLFDDIAADVSAKLDDVGGDIVEWLRDKLGIEVVRQGSRVTVRSRPGEYPRLETGKLQAGVLSVVEQSGYDITLTIADPVEYAIFLVHIRRIMMEELPDEFTETVADAVAAAISGR